MPKKPKAAPLPPFVWVREAFSIEEMQDLTNIALEKKLFLLKIHPVSDAFFRSWILFFGTSTAKKMLHPDLVADDG